jgi:hypothetical protein
VVNLCSDSPVDKAETLTIAGTLRLLHLLIRKGRGEREMDDNNRPSNHNNHRSNVDESRSNHNEF